MTIPKFEPKLMTSPASKPRVEVYTDSVVFNACRPDGTVEESVSVNLADLIQKAIDDEPTPLLLWGMFMQINKLNGLFEQARETTIDPLDPDFMAKRLMPMFKMVTGLMVHAGVNPEHISAATEAFEKLSGGDTSCGSELLAGAHVPEPQPAGAVRTSREE